MPQSTYFCVRLADGQLRHTAYGVGGNRYVLGEGKELARGERDALCTNYGITVLGARGQLATTAGHHSNYDHYNVDIVDPRARSLGLIGVARCFVDDAGKLTCMTDYAKGAGELAELLNQRGPIAHMVTTAPCAVYRDGQVACVTENGPAQLIPMWTGAHDAAIVSNGWSQYGGCALMRTGKVSCLGSNALALRGFARVHDRTPAEIPGLEQIEEIAVGGSTACARRGGTVWCWGETADGQAGAAALAASKALAKCVVDDAATQAAAREFEQAQKACQDPNRQRGHDDPYCRMMWQATRPGPIFKESVEPCDQTLGASAVKWAKPTRVDGIDDAIAIATNGRLSCALRSGSKLTCWGAGVTTPQTIAFPARSIAADPEIPAGTHVVPPRGVAVDVGEGEAIVTGASGARSRHALGGSLGAAQAMKPESTDPDVARVTKLMGTECVLRRDGILRCGNETMPSGAIARWAAQLSGAGPIVEHADWCARYLDGSARCMIDTKLATRWKSVQSISTGGVHTIACAVTERGEVQCVGYDGNGLTTIAGLPKARQVATTGSHTCALGQDGSAWCWERDLSSYGGKDRPAVEVRGVTGAIAIDVGPKHACAVTKAAKLMCWGTSSASVHTVATTID